MSQDSAALSLLSLSIAASNAQPIPLASSTAESTAANAGRHQQTPVHHRRLSSTGRRRRLSDARDAATRPSSVGGPALSMAALSLSSAGTSSASPPSLSAVSVAASAPTKSSTPIPIAPPSAGRGKKRGVDHKCESCSKIYRHPSCLIKHRWEHTPHWRTLSSLPHPTSSSASGTSASTGVLSKHAQVQLLEAAAILSHLSPDSETGTSLPEDRGMWPRWVSGGALEGEEVYGSVGGGSASAYGGGGGGVPESYGSSVGRSASASASAYGLRSASGGPRLHDYEVPRGAEVRAGVVEVPHHANGHGHGHHGHMHTRSAASAGAHSVGSAWSVPRSVSVSASVSSEQSRSRSTPSDDDEESVVDGEDGRGRGRAYAYTGRGGARVWKHEDEEGEEFEFDLGGVREEEGEGEEMEMDKYGHGHGRDYEHLRRGERESLRWGGMEEMDDIDMDMD